MHIGTTDMHVLVIEDNRGDFILIEEFLEEEIPNIKIDHLTTFEQAKERLIQKYPYHAILLDLSLPDCSGETLVNGITDLAPSVPVIVLTGFSDKEFGIRTLSLGVSDYLLKDELSASSLYKSIIYSMERKRINLQLKESEEKYRSLFDFSPQPMWVYDQKTLKFLNVNAAAIKNYGYSRSEFLNMTIKDIRPEEDLDLLEKAIKNRDGKGYFQGLFKHKKRNGEIIDVDIQSTDIEFDNKYGRLVLATDVSDRMAYIRAIEEQNYVMREIAWTQSHIVRAPLARIMGLVNILTDPDTKEEYQEVLELILESANELDSVVRDIVRKTENMEDAFEKNQRNNN